MSLINYVLLYDLTSYQYLFIAYYVITRVILCLYYKSCYIDKWYLGLLPFSSLFLQGQIASLPLWLKIVYILTGLLCFSKPFPYWIIWRAMVWLKDYYVGSVILDSPWKFMFIPFYRYYIFIIELLANSKEVDD